MKGLMTGLAVALASVGASAATLTFDGSICGPTGTGTCADGSEISQDYGDLPTVNVVYDSNRSVAGDSRVFFWLSGYETLERVAYGDTGNAAAGIGGLSITFLPTTGNEVVVTAFDIAPYLDRQSTTSYQVIDLANLVVLSQQTYPALTISGVTSITGSWASATGIRIDLGPDAWDVGIDNVSYSTRTITTPPPPPPNGAVPLPGTTALLLAGGLLGLSGMPRRPKTSSTSATSR